ncbi:hypothetical protein G5S52_07110 [Grimontia sp. S25]|uniref:HPt domain-containing protein n=1 Tax=Grimontia sedimenti TaxID=2711294 RepID=A0A6M1RDG8_9GAMM|nr:hypothetical protein [Grimontia sedimenti]NGN97442.1 hypothetical protein [Grimontia sedimenti]
MKVLGSFLLEAGLISASDLADAMVEQVRKTPHSVEILYEKGLISPEQLLAIVTLQNDENLDFRTACLQLNIWKSEFIDIINKEVEKRRGTLGQLLVERELIDPPVLLSVIKQYHAYRSENNNDFALFSENAILDLAEESGSDGAPAINYEPDFSQASEGNTSEYLDLFSEEKEIALELMILAIEKLGSDKSEDSPEELLDKFFTEYHSLKGTARGIGAVLTENLIHESEDVLAFYKRFLHKLESSDFSALAAVNLNVLDVLSQLRNELVVAESEQSFWGKEDKKAKYLKVLEDIHKLNHELQGRGYKVDIEEVKDMF